MNQAMLMKPPSILDQIVSQDSENYTTKSNAASVASKKRKKQNTIRIGNSPHDIPPKPRQYDNDSVHSNASGRSKGKKTKETTLTRPKITQSPKVQNEDDNHSVHSTGSRHSNKSGKKESNIMPRPKIEGTRKQHYEPEVRNRTQKNEQLSFKAAWDDQQESEINSYEIRNQRSPQVVNYEPKYEAPTIKTKEQKNAKYSPFTELEHQYSDEQPVIKLQEPSENKSPIIVGVKKIESQPKKVEEPQKQQKPTFVESRLSIDESNVVFGESKLRQTKSRRRNIFDRTLHNDSKVSNSIAQSSASGLEDTTGRKSKSRRREIFNSSRQKERQDSREGKGIKHSEKDMISMGSKPLQSKEFNQSTLNRSNFKPAAGANDKLVQLQRKVLDRDNDDFSLEESKSDLNLSTSNNLGRAELKDKDSLIFQFEPQKKKGVSLTSKQKIYGGRSRENKVQTSGSNDLPTIGHNLVSKEIEKNLKGNMEYLKMMEQQENGRNFKKETGKQPYLFNIEDDESQDINTLNIKNDEKPWHEIVGQYQHSNQVIPIKKVERNEKVVTKDDRDALREKEREIERQRQKEKQREKERQRLRQKQIQEQKEQEQKVRRERMEKQKRERQYELQKRKERERKQEEKRIQEEAQKNEQLRLQAQRRKEEERKKIELQKEAQRQIMIRKEEQERQRKARKEAQRRKIQREQMTAKQGKLPHQDQFLKLNHLPSSYSKDDSDNKSQKSNKSAKNIKRKKESSLTRDKNHNKAYVRAQSPRGEQSFYQPSEQESEKFVQKKQDKKPKIISFSDEQDAPKPKSKTDMNFYDYNQSQKSIKPPSSKPPLSRRSNGSAASTSKEKKPKEKTIAINIKEQGLRKFEKPKEKKMTLMERAMMKHNESNDSYSQDSYRDNFSSDSRRSNSSRNSRKSLKKESTLNITGTMIHSKCNKPPMEKKYSMGSSHEDEMQEIQRTREYERERTFDRERSAQKMRQMKNNVLNQRVIVSKNCTFIDQKGRLVQKDLVIRGKDVYGVPRKQMEDSSQYFNDRMRRSREQRKQRSKSRDKNKLSRNRSRDGSESGSCNQNSSYSSSSFYQNNPTQGYYNSGSAYVGFGGNNNQGNILREFIKPVEQVPMYSRQDESDIPRKSKNEARTLNQMFTRKNTNPLDYNNSSSNMSQSRASRKSLGRTERSRGRK